MGYLNIKIIKKCTPTSKIISGFDDTATALFLARFQETKKYIVYIFIMGCGGFTLWGDTKSSQYISLMSFQCQLNLK